MGVLACDRVGCESIMCDYYSHDFGYICYECKSELEQKGACNIQCFMDSEKKPIGTTEYWQGFVDSVFTRR